MQPVPDAVRDWLRDREIGRVECAITDFNGLSRGKQLAASAFCRGAPLRLPLDIFAQTIAGEYVSVYGEDGDVINARDADVVLQPDFSTLHPLPNSQEPVASVLCDVLSPDLQPLHHSPRQLLKKTLALYDAEGWRASVAPEFEFFLFSAPAPEPSELRPYKGSRFFHGLEAQPYSVEALGGFDSFVTTLLSDLRIQNIDADSLIKEVGPGQFEINLRHGHPLEIADASVRLKRTVRETAQKHDILASFMAKPLQGRAGSSMHLHISLRSNESDANIFNDDNGENSDLLYHFIGGLKHYLPQSILFFMPFANSFRRIEAGMSAPLNVEWAVDNRTVGLRIPSPGGGTGNDPSRRVENRLAGADCNPYMAIAVSLALGYQGIKEKRDPGAALQGSGYDLTPSIPQTLHAALEYARSSTMLRELLGAPLLDTYCAIKQKEWNHFNRVITPYELDMLSGII